MYSLMIDFICFGTVWCVTCYYQEACHVQVGLKAKMLSWVSYKKIIFSVRCLKHWEWNGHCWSVHRWVVAMHCHSWWCPVLRHAVNECRHLFHWRQLVHQGSPMHSIIVARYAFCILAQFSIWSAHYRTLFVADVMFFTFYLQQQQQQI